MSCSDSSSIGATLISGVVQGDTFYVTRDPVTEIDPADPIASASFTVKYIEDDTTDDTQAVFQKSITTTGTISGQVTDDGTADGEGALYFRLAPADTALLFPEVIYRYDIQLTTVSGDVFTPEVGTFQVVCDVTRS